MYKNVIKVILDRVFATILLILFSPFIILTALSIFITMRRPIFFTQKRPGLNGKIFTIYKFRTMNNKKDINGELLPDNERLGGVGAIIRSLSLDELPQLLNILNGDMSFVGPRPLLVEYLPLYNDRQKKRHNVLPGITGLAQISGRNAISWEQRFEYDVEYVKNQSFLLDLKIILLTIKKVLFRDGVSADGHVTMEKFRGNE